MVFWDCLWMIAPLSSLWSYWIRQSQSDKTVFALRRSPVVNMLFYSASWIWHFVRDISKKLQIFMNNFNQMKRKLLWKKRHCRKNSGSCFLEGARVWWRRVRNRVTIFPIPYNSAVPAHRVGCQDWGGKWSWFQLDLNFGTVEKIIMNLHHLVVLTSNIPLPLLPPSLSLSSA